MWQQCPQCKGSGISSSLISSYGICNVCNGSKIINELTGLPPNVIQSSNVTFGPLPEKYIGEGLENYNLKSTYQNTDFRDSGYKTQQEYYGK